MTTLPPGTGGTCIYCGTSVVYDFSLYEGDRWLTKDDPGARCTRALDGRHAVQPPPVVDPSHARPGEPPEHAGQRARCGHCPADLVGVVTPRGLGWAAVEPHPEFGAVLCPGQPGYLGWGPHVP